MDPSCTIGLYCRGLEEFHTLRSVTEKVLAPPKQKGVYPFFTFADMSIGETLDMTLNMQFGSVMSSSLEMHPDMTEVSATRNTPSDDEDFVIVDCKATKNLPRDSLLSTNITNGAVGSSRSGTHTNTVTKPVTTDVLISQSTMEARTVNNSTNSTNSGAEFDKDIGDFDEPLFDDD